MNLPKLTWMRPRDFRTCPFEVTPVPPKSWRALAMALGEGRLTLMSLWADADAAHMALHDPETRQIAVASVRARKGAFPSVSAHHPPAQRLERAAADLTGLIPEGAEDTRPWLDHGRWPLAHPLAARPAPPKEPAPYPFLPVRGESLHEVPVGPVHAGIIEPGHFRFTGQGETVVRLEERFGYTHKGIDRLMQGATLARGAQLAGRVVGDSTVAYTLAFAQAAEAALGVEPPERALWLRALMAELERLANHVSDFGAICNDAAYAMMLAQTSALREELLRAIDTLFGHRAMRDRIVPGGVTVDLDAGGIETLRHLTDTLRTRMTRLTSLYDHAASLLDRTVGTGHLAPDLARRFGAGGYVGRASGRDFDTRRDLPYAPYHLLRFEVPGRTEGDVNARIWQRIDEIRQSLALVNEIINTLPAGDLRRELPAAPDGPRAGLGLVEGFRGDVLVWLSLAADGTIERAHLRDPSWFQWPLLEAAIEGNIIADFPLCNKSFNCAYSGTDL